MNKLTHAMYLSNELHNSPQMSQFEVAVDVIGQLPETLVVGRT